MSSAQTRWLSATGAREVLAAGEVVLLNTDTLPGLHARLDRPQGLSRLRECKQREAARPFLVLAASCTDALALLAPAANPWFGYLQRCWPGPFTMILPAAPGSPPAVLAPTGTVAVRVPDRPPLRQLLADVGPLASTSANAPGEAPARTLREALEAFPALAAWDDGAEESLAGAPSALVDLTGDQPRLLRDGPEALPTWSATT